jgi:hypothetical protein
LLLLAIDVDVASMYRAVPNLALKGYEIGQEICKAARMDCERRSRAQNASASENARREDSPSPKTDVGSDPPKSICAWFVDFLATGQAQASVEPGQVLGMDGFDDVIQNAVNITAS